MATMDFVYACTGAEGADFSVSLPVAWPNDFYFVTASLAGVANLFAIDLPDLAATDRTTTQFRVVTSASVTNGDLIAFHVYDPASAWAIDATSGIAIPQSAGQWSALVASVGITGPDHLWLCQEASGNLADSIGTMTLTANASPSYQQSESGWSTKAVQFAQVAAQHFGKTSSGIDPSTTSVLALLYADFTSAPLADRQALTIGVTAVNSGLTVQSTGTLRLRGNGGLANSFTVWTASPRVHPFLVLTDITNLRRICYSDVEKWSTVWGTPSSGQNFGIGAFGGGGVSPSANILYVALWAGAHSEFTDGQARDLLVRLGWTVAW
jgi:hypothetical protein